MSTYQTGPPPIGDLARQEQQSTVRKPDDASSLILPAYLGAVFLPIVGAIIGIVLMSKNQFRHGGAALMISVLMMCFWFGFYTSQEQQEPSYQGPTIYQEQ